MLTGTVAALRQSSEWRGLSTADWGKVEHDVREAAQDHLKDWAGYICAATLFAGPAPIRKFIAADSFACL